MKNQNQNKPNNKITDIQSKRYIKKEERTTRIVFSIIIFSFIVLTGGTIYNIITNTNVPTTSVPIQTVFNPNLHTGVIVREEQTYSLSFPGSVRFVVNEHNRVRSGELVAVVENIRVTADIQEENRLLQAQILDIQEFRGPVSIHTDDAQMLNENIRETAFDNMHLLGYESNFNAYFFDIIYQQINYRNSLLLSESIGSISNYVEMLNQNSHFIASNQREIRATNGGIVTYFVDGHEYLTIENINNLSSGFLDIFEGQNHQNSGVFRVVTSNVWHIAAFFEPVEVAHLTIGQNTNIFLSSYDDYTGYNFRNVPVTISSREQHGGQVFVVFSMRDFMIDFIDQRIATFKLYDGNVTGLVVPNYAIAHRTLIMIPKKYVSTDVDYNNFVTMLNFSYTNFTENSIITVNPVTVRNNFHEDYIFVIQDFNGVSLGTVLVDSSGSQYVISRVITDTGVFRINNGVATFVSIDTTDQLVLEEYTILSVSYNQDRGGLIVHDRIVSNTRDYLVYAGKIVQ